MTEEKFPKRERRRLPGTMITMKYVGHDRFRVFVCVCVRGMIEEYNFL